MNELIKKFENEISLIMRKYGFGKKVVRNTLKRKTEYGFDSIQFMYKKNENSIIINVGLGVRHNDIMNLKYDALVESGFMVKDKDATSLGHYLHVIKALMNGTDTHIVNEPIEINQDSDISMICRKISADLVAHGMPFFDRYSSIYEVFKLAEDDSDIFGSLIPFDEHKAITALSISYLYNVGSLHQLIDEKRDYLESRNKHANQKSLKLKVYDMFVQYLKKKILSTSIRNKIGFWTNSKI